MAYYDIRIHNYILQKDHASVILELPAVISGEDSIFRSLTIAAILPSPIVHTIEIKATCAQ